MNDEEPEESGEISLILLASLIILLIVIIIIQDEKKHHPELFTQQISFSCTDETVQVSEDDFCSTLQGSDLLYYQTDDSAEPRSSIA